VNSRARGLVGGAPLLLALLAAAPGTAWGQTQAWVPGKGHGTATVAVQQLYISTHTLSDGTHGFPGTLTNRSVFLGLDYGLSDRWAINVQLPYKSNMFDGPGVHDPDTLDDDHDQHFIDDGEFHSGWQDVRVSLRYQWRSKPWMVTPFIAYGTPTHDYVTFAHSALGTGQWHLQAGVNVGRQFAPPLQNLYFQAGYAYSVMQEVEDRRVNHSTFSGEIGYFFTPKFSMSLLLVGQKTYNGFDFPEDYPNSHDDHFYHHDQNLRNDFWNIGASANYQFNDRYGGFLTYGHTLWGENTHLIDYAYTVGISRSF
jgi:hypothetical protein